MKPILWIDDLFLKFFTKIAKDFNWLTGKDNFFLAKTLLVIVAFKLALDWYLIHGFKNFLDFVLAGCCLILPASCYYVTCIEDRTQAREQLNSVKIHHSSHGILRALYWTALIILSVPTLMGVPWLWNPSTMLLLVSWSYFFSIPRPPFKKSQAWQKVKGLFGSPSAQPTVEPIPVQSN